MDQESTLVYKCPHCGAKTEVTEDMLGQVVDCPNADCDRPFRVEAPSAFPVSDAEAGDVVRAGGAPRGRKADAEEELLVLHPAVFRRRIFQSLGASALIVGGLGAAVWGATITNGWIGFGGLLAAVVGGLDLGYWWFRSLFVTLIVTNRRTILRKGLISKSTSEVEHDDVRNMQIDQNFVQRMLGIGDIAISSAGQNTLEISVRGIHDPEGIAAIVREHQD